MLPAETALLILCGVSGGVLVLLFVALVISEVWAVEPRHPYRDDIPEWWW